MKRWQTYNEAIGNPDIAFPDILQNPELKETAREVEARIKANEKFLYDVLKRTRFSGGNCAAMAFYTAFSATFFVAGGQPHLAAFSPLLALTANETGIRIGVAIGSLKDPLLRDADRIREELYFALIWIKETEGE